MRHSLLDTCLRFDRAFLPRLHVGFQSDQVLKTEAGSTGRRADERIGSRQAGPAGGKKAHAPGLVPIKHTLLSPLPAVSRQLQRLLKKWMGGMDY